MIMVNSDRMYEHDCIHAEQYLQSTEEKHCEGRAVISKQQPEDRNQSHIWDLLLFHSFHFCHVPKNYWHFNLRQLCPVNFNASRTSTRLHWHSYSYPLILQLGANVGWLSLQVFTVKDKQPHRAHIWLYAQWRQQWTEILLKLKLVVDSTVSTWLPSSVKILPGIWMRRHTRSDANQIVLNTENQLFLCPVLSTC